MTDGQRDFSQVRDAMDRLVKNDILPGVSISVQQDQTTVFTCCSGWADRENRIELTPEHLFRGYSNTKLATSCAALLLMEQGALRLDDPLEKYLPEFAAMRVLNPDATTLGDTQPAERPIRLRHLLTHTSGISYDFLTPGSLIAGAYDAINLRDPAGTLADTVDKLATLPLVCHPGTGWNYSFSTDVVARVVEVAGGKPFGAFLQERIFDPLGMTDTGYWVPAEKRHLLTRLYAGASAEDPNLPGLTPNAEKSCNEDLFRKPSLEMGGSGLLFSLPDMVRLLNALNVGETRLLGPEALALVYENLLPEGLWMQFPGFGELTGKAHSAAGSVSVAAFPHEHPDTAGSIWWGGVAGTQWWLSPQTGMSAAVMTQRENGFAHPFATELKNIVFQCLEV